jgi:transaldolase
MKIFLDSANLEEIEKASKLKVVDGITTNPTLMAKSGANLSMAKLIKKICSLISGLVSVEGVAIKKDEIIKEGKELAKIAKNIVYKIPISEDGLAAAYELEKQGVKTNITLVFSLSQALLAAKVGASFVSPFIGRLEDNGEDGLKLIEEIVSVFNRYQFKSQIIAASVRNVYHVKKAAFLGCHIATVPYKVLTQMYRHFLTDKGLQVFLADWQKIKK